MYLLLVMSIKVYLGKGFLKYEIIVLLYSDFEFDRHDELYCRTHDFNFFFLRVFSEALGRTREGIGCDV